MDQKSLISKKDSIITRLKNKLIQLFSFPNRSKKDFFKEEKIVDNLSSDESDDVNIFSLDDIYIEDDDLAFAYNNITSKKMEPMISDKNTYDLVMEKLKAGEISDDELAISDLLKINLMLESEIDIKMNKYDIEEKMKYDKKIEDLKKEISILEKKVGK